MDGCTVVNGVTSCVLDVAELANTGMNTGAGLLLAAVLIGLGTLLVHLRHRMGSGGVAPVPPRNGGPSTAPDHGPIGPAGSSTGHRERKC